MKNNSLQIRPKLDIAAQNSDLAKRGLFDLSKLEEGSTFESRIKTKEAIIRKVALHRLRGNKNYRLEDVNDVYGGRFTVKTHEQMEKIIHGIHSLEKEGAFKILKEEEVNRANYRAYHIDFIGQDEVRGELIVQLV